MNHADIREAIVEYARGYKRLQGIQDLPGASAWIPKGDQKTGCIGEYYAMLLVRQQYPGVEARFGHHSEKGWDIEITIDPIKRIQVKTVSAYSKTRVLSPVHDGWDELWVVYLDVSLEPLGLWVITTSDFFATWPVKGLRCPRPGGCSSGSSLFKGKENTVRELLDALAKTP